MNLQMNFHQ